ncbi:pentapeptide repeat-containing protein [Campylobacter peloridis]|uniref:Pentapeptide repeat-containing protein n=1 Tax=Campylobacter peloridis TaxID=488546 RepID=A0ABX6TRT7_9BACT|nr:pentapeptide repeat-containing protein [Campylobacter peloridis]AJC84366.1 hypothetical membrane protein [Campylobacter peloridis LMG 23910]QOQ88462.1 pentapeptide repeat-containing protein [Campylobacter peloridis]
MCKIVLNQNMQDFLLQQIEKEIPLEIFLDTQVNKETLKQNIYDRVIGVFEGYQRYGMKKDINKDTLKEETKKISYEITSKKILSREFEIDENYIFVGTDIIIISHQESFPYDENTENLIKKQSDERLVIEKADIRLFSQFPLHFIRCDFQCEIKNTFWNYLECENLSFENCNFYKEVYFGFQKKFKLLIMENCYFHNKVYFSGVFKENAFFNNSHFKDYVDFHACEFEKIACFYGVTFNKAPNFSQVVFKDNTNLVNMKASFDFRNLNIAIKNINKSKDEAANDFRDYFRVFKNILIKDNNLLNASKFHKYELYCKEIELNSKKSKIFSKEWIDKYQLFFYRKLCDHHTDLILNVKWLIITIGMFASILFMIKLYKHGLSILNIFNFYGLYLSALGSFVLSALALFGCIDKMKAFVSINAITILWVICYKPKLIFGIANLIGDNSYNAFENLLITLYTLIAGLIIFSLQKTARKNTIIPN